MPDGLRMGEPWLVLGEHADEWGTLVRVGLPMPDLRVHASVLGTTGSGKSTFLRNLALQSFLLGATTVVIEPHGDLILHPEEGILAALPSSLLDRVVVFDLNSAWPPQVNLVSAGRVAGDSVAVDVAMRCIRVVEEASWTVAVQMREILEHALYVLLDVYGLQASMVHLMRFLTDAPNRDRALAKASESVVESREYWRRLLERMEGGGGRRVDLDVPIRRVGKFLRDQRFRHSLALPALGRELEVGRLLDAPEPHLILVPLRSSELGEEAKRVFGTLFMQKLTSAFLARKPSSRRQAVVIIDEFADLAGGEVGELTKQLLAQARKFGASVVLATQSIYQLPNDVKQEVKSNANIKVVLMTSGPDDAREAIKNLASDQLSDVDMMAIERFHGYARVMVHGERQPPFYFKTLAPLWPAERNARYQAPRDEVEFPELRSLHDLARLDSGAAIGKLTSMADEEFRRTVEQQKQDGEQLAAALLADPGLEPDPVRRALRISRTRYGLPWWFYEAYYRRLRFQQP